MKYTQGKWTCRQARGNNIYEHRIYAGRDLIAELNPPDHVKTSGNIEVSENIKANAYLIAAAPEMLEALEKVKIAFETLEKWGKVPMQVVMLRYGINEIESVIKKAKGE